MFKNHSRFSYPHFHNQSTVLLKLEIIRSYSRVGLLTVRECVTFCGFCKTLLLSRLRVEHIPHSITLYVRSLIPYISHITIMCWTLNREQQGAQGERTWVTFNTFLLLALRPATSYYCRAARQPLMRISISRF